ncbi:MAG: ribosomal-protein-alanine N-acetyltransferase [Aeromicrobium sp.]|nr:ribosomal-protein-alanine N-acetyltransferase [Aeromicrobium sp.]
MTRHATADDVDAIVAIERACFGSAAWSRQLVSDEIGSERHVVRIAATGDAYGAISLAGEDADLDRIATLPAARGRGLARELLDALVDEARDRGAGRMLLEVAADNAAAINLYESTGFATVGRRAGYYSGGVDALVMETTIEEWR